MSFAIVTIGGSAGALPALQGIARRLPAAFPAAVFVVTHVPADRISSLPHILSRSGEILAAHAVEGAAITPGVIAIAPPNHHLAIEPGFMRVTGGPKVHGQRPSIDVLFQTAAQAYGKSVCGVLLSGALDDGVAGFKAIRSAGGVTIVEDPREALFGDLPRNAIAAHTVDHIVACEDLPAAIQDAVAEILAA